MRLNKLNGWQRIGVIISVLWLAFIVVLSFNFIGIIDPYDLPMLYRFTEFLGLPYMGASHELLVVLLAISIPIITGWLSVYLFIWAITWVKNGFASTSKK